MIQIQQKDRDMVRSFFIKHWGSPQMVVSSGNYQCDELEGMYVKDDEGNIHALLTYMIRSGECEIVSIDCTKPNKGFGKQLLQAAEAVAKAAGCYRMKVITTNDNFDALRFFQKNHYFLSELRVKAVDQARTVKREIPLVSAEGVAIRDELILVKSL
ncbi:GNAT family N-acetyltransferase [Mangrovibacillus cuniculi]|uniref:GNAT family N-acetyltransferase n=1 Tax=Mangrovibacillus cuniculi TaxID=2593652 RepID=A0A7S8C9Q9_9BACI|nr:GNAT family N-acetyltransferase [Mangrovibacillus cuniculi]QPC45851.1 GNAT family N-acetyltransferase [Mangrovibacillus cuniculi]